MTLKPNIDQINTPADLVAALNQARAWAGDPTYRELETRSRHELSYGTFRNMLRSPDLPKFGHMLTLVAALGLKDDEAMWATAWRRIRLGHTDQPGTDPKEV